MTPEMIFVTAVFAGMIYLFLTDKLPVDLTALSGLLLLTLSGILTADEAFSGFSSPAVLTMLSMFFIAASLKNTGVTERIAGLLYSTAGTHERAAIFLLTLTGAFFSAFMNNVAATAVLLPAATSYSRLSGVAASRLLMPLAFGTVLGGMTTGIGTPPNILATEILRARGLKTFDFFTFTPYGLSMTLAGAVLLALIVPVLVPTRDTARRVQRARDLAKAYKLQERVFSLRVPAGSRVAGSTLAESDFQRILGAETIGVRRGEKTILAPSPQFIIEEEDELFVTGRVHELRILKRLTGISLQALTPLLRERFPEDMQGRRLKVTGGLLKDRTLRALQLRQKYDVIVVGVERAENLISDRLSALTIESGDIIFAAGSAEALEKLASEPGLEPVNEMSAFRDLFHDHTFFMKLPDESPLYGLTLAENRIGELVGLTVLAVVQKEKIEVFPPPDYILQKSDNLIVVGASERVAKLSNLIEFEIVAEEVDVSLESEDIGLAEVVIPPRSSLAGKTLAQISFRERFGMRVVAVWREGKPRRAHLSSLRLSHGDGLLLQGPKSKIQLLPDEQDFVLVSEVATARYPQKAPWVVLSIILMIALSALQVQPIHVAALLAALLVVFSGAISMAQGYRETDWRILALVAAIIPVGVAMEKTGIAELVARTTVHMVGPYGPVALIIVFALLSSIISQLLDSVLAVVLLSPILFETASRLGVDVEPLMMATALGASIAFLTPFSHKGNLLVVAPGGYKPKDFLRVGSGLTILCFLLLTVLLLVLPPV